MKHCNKKNHRITKLTDNDVPNDILMVQAFTYQTEQREILVQIREPKSSGGRLGKVIEEYTELRTFNREELSGDIFLFYKHGYDLMFRNYKLGTGSNNPNHNCYIRYSEACYTNGCWSGRPGHLARNILKQGVACPKEIYSLFKHVEDEC